MLFLYKLCATPFQPTFFFYRQKLFGKVFVFILSLIKEEEKKSFISFSQYLSAEQALLFLLWDFVFLYSMS